MESSSIPAASPSFTASFDDFDVSPVEPAAVSTLPLESATLPAERLIDDFADFDVSTPASEAVAAPAAQASQSLMDDFADFDVGTPAAMPAPAASPAPPPTPALLDDFADFEVSTPATASAPVDDFAAFADQQTTDNTPSSEQAAPTSVASSSAPAEEGGTWQSSFEVTE